MIKRYYIVTDKGYFKQHTKSGDNFAQDMKDAHGFDLEQAAEDYVNENANNVYSGIPSVEWLIIHAIFTRP